MKANKRRGSSAVAVVALVLGGLGATVVAQGASGHKNARHHHALAHASALQGARAYSLLERAPTSADEENAAVTAAASHYPGLEPSLARVVSDTGDGRAWLMPTSTGELCLGFQPAEGVYAAREQERHLQHLTLGFTCATVEKVDHEGITCRVYDDVTGVVPDGVSAITYKIGEAPEETEAVVGNVFTYTMPDVGFVPHWFSFESPDGEKVFHRL
jgi:hypothetical protein